MKPDSATFSASRLAELNPWFDNLEPRTLDAIVQHFELQELQRGDTLFAAGDEVDALYIVLDGALEAMLEEGQSVHIVAGEPAGEFQILDGGRRNNSVIAAQDTLLARCSRKRFVQLAQQHAALETLARDYSDYRVRRNLLKAVLPNLIDEVSERLIAALEFHGVWQHLASGSYFCRAGDVSDSMSLLVSGRLAVQGSHHGLKTIYPGESVGEIGLLLTNQTRSADVFALRDCEILTLSREEYDHLCHDHPELYRILAQLLARRLRDFQVPAKTDHSRIITLFGLDDAVDFHGFSEQLTSALQQYGNTLVLSSDNVGRFSGMQQAHLLGPGDAAHLRLSNWLEQQEDEYELILMLADAGLTGWTRRCLRQSDVLLLISRFAAEPESSSTEQQIMAEVAQKAGLNTHLVLIHPNRDQPPINTRRWLSARKVDTHFHLCFDRASDYARLARRCIGRSIGLVCSGGGARTIAQVGVLKAFDEAGIPIDAVGGTSGGAHVAIHFAMGKTPDEICAAAKEGMIEQKPYRKMTFPYVSLVRRSGLLSLAQQHYGQLDFEDLWLPTYSVACNLSTGDKVIHDSGSLLHGGLATGAIPVMFPPEVEGNHLLVDGGVVDNMPVEAMRERDVHHIIGIDVSPKSYLMADYPGGALPSGWRLIAHRLLPYLKKLEAPTILDIIMRLVTLNDVKTRDGARNACDLLIVPPIESFGMLEFSAMDEMVDMGYQHTLELIQSDRLQFVKASRK